MARNSKKPRFALGGPVYDGARKLFGIITDIRLNVPHAGNIYTILWTDGYTNDVYEKTVEHMKRNLALLMSKKDLEGNET
jgi:hypothetical protein